MEAARAGRSLRRRHFIAAVGVRQIAGRAVASAKEVALMPVRLGPKADRQFMCGSGFPDPARVVSLNRSSKTMLHIIWYIIIGFVVGLIARAIMPGAQQLGFIMTTLIGI